jgi:hypothetical protein
MQESSMNKIASLMAVSAMLLSAAASAARPEPLHEPAEGFYVPGNQYTASLDQTHNQWRLQPASGEDLVVDLGTCATGAMIPAGVWLLVLDSRGRPELLAPSVTPLPAGSADHVALRSCETAQGSELAVPAALLKLLGERTGAVYVYN